MSESDKIAILIVEFQGGGVSRMMVNLANGFARLGITTELLLPAAHPPFLENLDQAVKRVTLDTESEQSLVGQVAGYLTHEKPAVMLSAMLKDHCLARTARQQAAAATRLFFRSGTNYQEEVRTTPFFRRRKHAEKIRNTYQGADGLIAVSEGVATGLTRICCVPATIIHTLKNPTVTPELLQQAELPATHPWLNHKTTPVIVSVGGLSRRKNFELLIDAVALVNRQQTCRLIIIGDGRRMERLKKRSQKKGIAEQVDFTGFCANPYPYMKHADLTVLSSNREGSPNVLVESLAVGTPVVSTDCPSGPQEILAQGRYGTIVPMKNAKALARGILAMLASPTSGELMQQAVLPYQQRQSAMGYVKAFGLAHCLDKA